MRTQHAYVGKLVGFFFFAGTIALYSGGCGKTLSPDNQARACPYGDRGTLGSDPMTGPGNTEVQTICDEPCGSSYEPGYLAYCDPASSGTTSAEVVITEEDPSGSPGDTDNGCWMPTAPGRDDGKETAADANSVAAVTERPDVTATDEATGALLRNVRLVVSTWWEAIVTVDHGVDVRPCEGYIPSTPRDAEVGESTDGLTSEPPP